MCQRSVFFIISLSIFTLFWWNVWMQFICFVFNMDIHTDTHTHSWLFKFIIAIYMDVLLCKPWMYLISEGNSFNPLPIQNISKIVKLTHSWPIRIKIIHLTLCHSELVNGYLINIFMVRAPGDHSFNPLPTANIWPMHLRINHLTFCNPEYVKGYLIYPFMTSAPDDNLFDPLPKENILKVVKLTHSWPEHHHAIHFTLYHP